MGLSALLSTPWMERKLGFLLNSKREKYFMNHVSWDLCLNMQRSALWANSMNQLLNINDKHLFINIKYEYIKKYTTSCAFVGKK